MYYVGRVCNVIVCSVEPWFECQRLCSLTLCESPVNPLHGFLRSPSGYRMSPLTSHVDEEVESQHLRFLAAPPGIEYEHQIITRFDQASLCVRQA